MLQNDLLLRALKGEKLQRPPVWMMRQAGRYLPEYLALKAKYDFFTRVQTPELAAEITLQPIDIVGTDAAIIFSDILKAGGLGLIQALVVVIAVWYFAFWVCKKMGVDEEMTMMLSSAVSICGVSAAIATSGAIKGDNKKLSYVISLVLIIAIHTEINSCIRF